MRARPASLTVSLLLLVALIPPARAEEHVSLFGSELIISAEGEVVVTDTIQAHSEGEKIKFGVLRELPQTVEYSETVSRVPRYSVRQVQVDGEILTPLTASHPQRYRIYLGSKSKELSSGPHTFFTQYSVRDVIASIRDRDVLRWDVTGSYFAVPVEKVIAIVKLERTINPATLRSSAYTGVPSQRTMDFTLTSTEEGDLKFETTRTLLPHETLHIELDWIRPR